MSHNAYGLPSRDGKVSLRQWNLSAVEFVGPTGKKLAVTGCYAYFAQSVAQWFTIFAGQKRG
jgi:hypothetical protein